MHSYDRDMLLRLSTYRRSCDLLLHGCFADRTQVQYHTHSRLTGSIPEFKASRWTGEEEEERARNFASHELYHATMAEVAKM